MDPMIFATCAVNASQSRSPGGVPGGASQFAWRLPGPPAQLPEHARALGESHLRSDLIRRETGRLQQPLGNLRALPLQVRVRSQPVNHREETQEVVLRKASHARQIIEGNLTSVCRV